MLPQQPTHTLRPLVGVFSPVCAHASGWNSAARDTESRAEL